jgi:hypothetical protein
MIRSSHYKAIQALALLSLSFFVIDLEGGDNKVSDDLLQKIIQQATENEQKIEDYGFDCKVVVQKFKGNGQLKNSEVRDYRTEWKEREPEIQLYRINSQSLTLKQRKENEESKKEWKKTVATGINRQRAQHRMPLSWDEIIQKYDFVQIPGDGLTTYILSFTPKKTPLLERNRMEKVLNNLSGTLWVDEQFRIIQFQASLKDKVSFGFGLMKVTALQLNYTQKPYENVLLPDSFQLSINVDALIFYSERREISTSFSNYHREPGLNESPVTVGIAAGSR